MANKDLLWAWDKAADALEHDPMRPVRYGKCFRYLHDVDRDSKLLDVGCGEGMGLLIARHLGFKKIVGVEVSKERLKRAKDRLGNEALLILVAPDSHLPFRNDAFDILISAAVIEHTLNPEDFVREIARVVRPGGYVIISSDCYQWRILQMLGIYKSVQPIDKALFPTALFRIFKKNRLQVLHYEGFPLPGQEFRFLRLFMRAMLSLPRRLLRKLMPEWVKLRVGTLHIAGRPKNLEQQGTRNITPAQNIFALDTWSTKRSIWQKIWGFLKLVFSDENVFFCTKE